MFVKTFAIYVLAGLGELGARTASDDGCANTARVGRRAGLGRLLGRAVVQTLQPEGRYSRVYAAYGGIFLVGAAITILEAVVVPFGREVLAQDCSQGSASEGVTTSSR